MEFLESKDNFPDVHSDLVFCKLFMLVQVSKQFSSVHIICNLSKYIA